MNTGEAAERFVRVWARAWAEHDVDALPELYAEDCVHRSMPFREPRRGGPSWPPASGGRSRPTGWAMCGSRHPSSVNRVSPWPSSGC